MNRKLHNTLMAVIASSSLLTLGLIAGSPAIPSQHDSVASYAIASTEEKVAPRQDAAIATHESPAASQPAAPRSVRGSRQSVSMPFFSFVPRG